MKNYVFLLFITLSLNSFGQFNVDSVSNIRYLNTHSTLLNDIWGYTDELGNEYALVGAEKGVGIVDVSIPSNPQEIFWEGGTQSVWRDLKTYSDVAYVTTEASSGLMIIDLSPLPVLPISPANYYNGPVGQEWASAHNLYIDEQNGFAYIFGSNRGNGGVIILDLSDPLNPTEAGVFDDWYVHDGFVRNDTMFLGHIYEGFFSMVDVTDKSNPVLLGTQLTPSTFSHNVWATGNGDFAFSTDEVSGGYIGAFDVSDPTNIVEIDRIQSSPNEGYIIPHNTHVKGNHIITSYYTDGVVIHDVTYPYNMIEVGQYDTHPTQSPQFDGCWGVYPFFASGTIIASDRSEGLFVLAPNYIQGCYLEGVITDASTTALLSDVTVTIDANNITESSSSVGFYATGVAAPGTYSISYFKVGYYPQTISVDLLTGIIDIEDIQLVPIPPFNLTVTVLESGTNLPISGANISLMIPLSSLSGTTNAIGEEQLSMYYPEFYEVIVGKWGYVTSCSNEFINNVTNNITVYLDKGYYDDFTFDFGWTSSGTALSGVWQRGVPFGTSTGSAPSADVNGDCGNKAFLTGNSDNQDPDYDDIDNGTADLTSPIMDLTTYTDPYVNYYRWFYNEHGGPLIDDTLRVFVSNGTESVEIDKVGKDPLYWDQWSLRSFRLEDYITISSTMQFFFRTSDLDPNINITEAGLDHFEILNASDVGVTELSKSLRLYPNPTNDFIQIEGVETNSNYRVANMSGQILITGEVTPNNYRINLSRLQSGIYFIEIANQSFKIVKGE